MTPITPMPFLILPGEWAQLATGRIEHAEPRDRAALATTPTRWPWTEARHDQTRIGVFGVIGGLFPAALSVLLASRGPQPGWSRLCC